MTERDIGTEILKGVREIKAHKEGKVDLKVRDVTNLEKSSTRFHSYRNRTSLNY